MAISKHLGKIAVGAAIATFALPAGIAMACVTPPAPVHYQQHDDHGHDDGDGGGNQPCVPQFPCLIDTTIPQPPGTYPCPPQPIIVVPPYVQPVTPNPTVPQVTTPVVTTTPVVNVTAPAPVVNVTTPQPVIEIVTAPADPPSTTGTTATSPSTPTGRVLTIHPDDTWKKHRIVKFSVQVAGPGADGAQLQYFELQQQGKKWVHVATGFAPRSHVFNVPVHHAYAVRAVNGPAYSVTWTMQ